MSTVNEAARRFADETKSSMPIELLEKLEAQETDKRFAKLAAWSLLPLLGNVDVSIEGGEHLITALQLQLQQGYPLVAAISHLDNVAMAGALAFMGPFAKFMIPVASTNKDLPVHRLITGPIVDRFVGDGRLYDVPHTGTGHERQPHPFDPHDYDPLVELVKDKNFAILVAAHNPLTNKGMENNGRLPEKPGKLAPHLVLALGGVALPVLVYIEGQREKPHQYNEDKPVPLWELLRKTDVLIAFGEPLIPDPNKVKIYKGLLGPSCPDHTLDKLDHLNKKYRHEVDLGRTAIDAMAIRGDFGDEIMGSLRKKMKSAT